MRKFRDVHFTLRIVTGSIILLHGLLRIIFINKHIDFVFQNFSDLVATETILLVGAALFPFIEFFTGLLIITNVAIKRSLVAGFFISIIMVGFILIAGLYPRLIYHSVVFALLFLLTDKQNKLRARRLI